MLRIRKEQELALDAVMRATFVKRTVDHLRETFPEEVGEQSDAELTSLTEEGITRAEEYGIKSEREVVLFIDLMAGLGSSFTEQQQYDWIVRILKDEDYGPPQKMELIYRRLEAQLRLDDK